MATSSRRARRFYARALQQDEEIVRSHLGYAPRTGTLIAAGTVLGGVIGWLYAIYLEAALLPALVLGSLGGIIVGYFYAEHRARLPGGPGATIFTLLITNGRLLVLRRYSPIRPRVLRSYELHSIAVAAARRLPVGNYHRTTLETGPDQELTLITAGELRIEP